jgi:hypothetical protein
MAREISYENLEGIDPLYSDKLRQRENVIRQVLEERGHDSPVRWLCIDDGLQNYIFRLVSATDETDCILQLSPLDLTLESEQFEQMLREGKRSCVGNTP